MGLSALFPEFVTFGRCGGRSSAGTPSISSPGRAARLGCRRCRAETRSSGCSRSRPIRASGPSSRSWRSGPATGPKSSLDMGDYAPEFGLRRVHGKGGLEATVRSPRWRGPSSLTTSRTNGPVLLALNRIFVVRYRT
jgi:hypothetical protein